MIVLNSQEVANGQDDFLFDLVCLSNVFRNSKLFTTTTATWQNATIFELSIVEQLYYMYNVVLVTFKGNDGVCT